MTIELFECNKNGDSEPDNVYFSCLALKLFGVSNVSKALGQSSVKFLIKKYSQKLVYIDVVLLATIILEAVLKVVVVLILFQFLKCVSSFAIFF